jgi:hypothetical protein
VGRHRDIGDFKTNEGAIVTALPTGLGAGESTCSERRMDIGSPGSISIRFCTRETKKAKKCRSVRGTSRHF